MLFRDLKLILICRPKWINFIVTIMRALVNWQPCILLNCINIRCIPRDHGFGRGEGPCAFVDRSRCGGTQLCQPMSVVRTQWSRVHASSAIDCTRPCPCPCLCPRLNRESATVTNRVKDYCLWCAKLVYL